jgi:hypothetical protein
MSSLGEVRKKKEKNGRVLFFIFENLAFGRLK